MVSNPMAFQPIPIAGVRYLSQIVDNFYGNNDGALSAQEAQNGAQLMQFWNANYSNAFSQIATALQQGNTRVDPNRDGRMTFRELGFGGFPTSPSILSELSQLGQRSGQPDILEPSDLIAQMPPPPPTNTFNPVNLESARQASQWVDFSLGNRDGMIDRQEATFASNYLSQFSPDLGRMFGRIADAFSTGNRAVDPNGDNRMSYFNFWWTGTTSPDELTRLAGNSGSPNQIETSDFNLMMPLGF